VDNNFEMGKEADLEVICNLFDFGKGLTLRLYVICLILGRG